MTSSAAAASVRPPSRFWLMLEGRAVYELASTMVAMPWLLKAPRGDGHPVLVLPGFLASGASTGPLRRYLRKLGYQTHCWGLGRNLGLRPGVEERMVERLDQLIERYQQPVSLVGWSLGGVFARYLAGRHPDKMRQVITLGSPFNEDPRANHSWKLYEWVSGSRLDDIDAEKFASIRGPLSVPSTAIFSRTDGVAAWRCCIDRESELAENVEVPGSHLGLGVNPLVLHVIADRLAQPADAWKPFERSGMRSYLFPKRSLD